MGNIIELILSLSNIILEMHSSKRYSLLCIHSILYELVLLYININDINSAQVKISGGNTPEVHTARSKLDGVLQTLRAKKDDP